MKKALGTVFLLIIIIFVGWRLYAVITAKSVTRQRPNATAAVAVAVKPVRIDAIRDVRIFTGTVLPEEQFVLAPKVAGRLEKLFVNIGDIVRNGDPIAVLDSEEYSQQVEQARAELDVAKAVATEMRSSLDVAEREYNRTKELRKGGVSSESEMDQTEARFYSSKAKHQVALAQIKQKDAALKGAEVRLAYTRISADWDGGSGTRVVGERFVDEGTMLRANEPIVSILDINSVLVTLFVIERDYPRVTEGQTAIISTDAFPTQSFRGTVVRKAPLLKETSRQARVEIEVPNPGYLLAPGMFVRAEIQFTVRQKATVVPVAAIVRRDNTSGLFIADTTLMQARFIPVTVGIVNGSSAEIVTPPLDGQVVVLGQHLLEDGSAIVIPDAAPAVPSPESTAGVR